MGNLGKQFFKKYTMIDFAVFETTGVIFGLLIIKLFPVVMTIHIGWYIGVFAATAGYLFAKIFTKK